MCRNMIVLFDDYTHSCMHFIFQFLYLSNPFSMCILITLIIICIHIIFCVADTNVS
jgi:hypothetical protein